MKNLPDFIIIGAMKSATSTLYDQLVSQPGIFMTVPKEPNFFSDDEQYTKGLDWYKSLYSEAAEGDILGEASTHYTKLPTYPETIERIKQAGLKPRLIYVMRHPVDRLISHYMHEYSQGEISCDINDAITKYDSLITYSKYSVQLEPYIKTFGFESILPVFFDSFRLNPESELTRICDFIGYSHKPEWVAELAKGNVSSKRIRKFPLYNILVDSKLATWFRRKFIPKSIRSTIKNSLRQQKRPQLNVKSLKELENIFNQDLNIIGNWLGVDISCENFKEITSNDILKWNV